MSAIDLTLTAQFIVAWAGESGDEDEPRMGWWRSDLVSEFGGQDLFERLLPNSWRWAVLQGAREAARRRDEVSRQRDHNPDRLISLFNLGFDLNERIEERLRELKTAHSAPMEALPGLKAFLEDDEWDQDVFVDWVKAHGEVKSERALAGRRLTGTPPEALDQLTKRLVAGLAPLADQYPLPHYHSRNT